MKKRAILTLAAAAASIALAGGTQAQAQTVAASATSATASATHSTLATSTTSAARTAAISAGKQIRYAWVKSCGKKDNYVPCGPWAIRLSNGKDVKLTDAQVFPKGANGKVSKATAAPIAVSGDGSSIAYFRKSDAKLVVRDIVKNRVRVLPGTSAKLPRGLGMSNLHLTLSWTGDVVMLRYQYDGDPVLPTMIVDLRSRKIGKLKMNLDIQDLSPDGKHILATRRTSENTFEFATYGSDGRKVNSQIVPQVVANNNPVALADNGTTLAVVIDHQSSKQRLRTYDLAGDTVGDSVDVKIPKEESVYVLQWNPDGGLTTWSLGYDRESYPNEATLRELDPATGNTTKIYSFKIPSNVWGWSLSGE